ncbi:hypothetical protein K8Z49_07235 [Actinomadura madurae]|uniref:DUF3817 domain-containing protein n=1 Tax=Actinomadura madurae TaxID=1993 RepID=A0A1I5URJ8_9ACTN|nr:DUF3817 domain-containing protein [Actinomadura madurae]SFP97903.1 hypothetical protein SAMN04489713_12070 [Actinomadura madurae]SPT56608.1 Uncharacterised protein [Actinomadura madurae]
MRALRIAAAAEAVSLVVLLVNLATVHAPAVSSLIGPLHGTAYLAVIALTLLEPPVPGARLRAVVPGIGGLLALRRLGTRDAQPS